jgi:hypothetical protein
VDASLGRGRSERKPEPSRQDVGRSPDDVFGLPPATPIEICGVYDSEVQGESVEFRAFGAPVQTVGEDGSTVYEIEGRFTGPWLGLPEEELTKVRLVFPTYRITHGGTWNASHAAVVWGWSKERRDRLVRALRIKRKLKASKERAAVVARAKATRDLDALIAAGKLCSALGVVLSEAKVRLCLCLTCKHQAAYGPCGTCQCRNGER